MRKHTGTAKNGVQKGRAAFFQCGLEEHGLETAPRRQQCYWRSWPLERTDARPLFGDQLDVTNRTLPQLQHMQAILLIYVDARMSTLYFSFTAAPSWVELLNACPIGVHLTN